MKLTIITINLNNAEGLNKTIESVVNQTYKDFEYIVIDGASTDSSVEVIKEYADKINYWVSEPDKGIYNAMNKGILQASGEFLLMLNSGDILFERNTLNNVFSLNLDKDIIFGDVYFLSDSGNFKTTYPEIINFSLFLEHGIHHQSVFIKKELHFKIGLYNESMKIVSDWIFLIQAFCRYNCSYKHVSEIISTCTRDGISCNPKFRNKIVEEREIFLRNEFSTFINDYHHYNKLKEDYKQAICEISKLNRNTIIGFIKRIFRKLPFIISIKKNKYLK